MNFQENSWSHFWNSSRKTSETSERIHGVTSRRIPSGEIFDGSSGIDHGGTSGRIPGEVPKDLEILEGFLGHSRKVYRRNFQNNFDRNGRKNSQRNVKNYFQRDC